MMLVGMGGVFVARARIGDAFHLAKYPAARGIWATVNFWPQIAFAFTGMELCSSMSEEVREPAENFSARDFWIGHLIAVIYIAGTVAVLSHDEQRETVDPKSGVFQALTAGSRMLGIARWE